MAKRGGGNANQAPVILSQEYLLDYDAADGTLVGIVYATDPDNDMLTFSLSGFEDSSYSGYFSIDERTGAITVASGADLSLFGSYDLTVSVSDGKTTSTAHMKIVLGNVVNLASLAPEDGFLIHGPPPIEGLGWSVASLGDVNNDGHSDIAISSLRSAHIIFGKDGGTTLNDIDLGTPLSADGSGFSMSSDSGNFGNSISGVGDINGDGIDDFLVSDFLADGADGSLLNAGAVYVVYGKADGSFADVPNVNTLQAPDGFVIWGVDAGDYTGDGVCGGDINHDGYSDLIITTAGIGAPNSNPHTRAVSETFVIFGEQDVANVDLSDPTSYEGFRVYGKAATDGSGGPISVIGDINNDGIDDFALGANNTDSNGSSKSFEGVAYVLFGHSGTSDTWHDISLGNLSNADGFKILGVDANDELGGEISGAGDVNGDGVDDVIVAARRGDGLSNGKSDAGEVYVIYGKDGLSADIDLSKLTSHDGFRIYGRDAGDLFGDSVAAAGDVNGDGFGDLIVGASLAAGAGNLSPKAGEVYVIFGGEGMTDIDLADSTSWDGILLYGAKAEDHAGFSVSSAGDVNSDGYGDLIIGAPLADISGQDSGAAYVLYGRNFDAGSSFLV